MPIQDPPHLKRANGFNALAAIRSPDINMVVAENVVPQAVMDYFLDMDYYSTFKSDWNAQKPTMIGCLRTCGACLLPRKEDGKATHIIPARWREFNPESDHAMTQIQQGLVRFPEGAGRDALAENLLVILKNFSAATGTKELDPFIMIKNPADIAGWHRDNYTDVRGLVTFVGPGTYWRPNESVSAEQRAENKVLEGERSNYFGTFGETFMEAARQEKSGNLLIWKGDAHNDSLIHSEPSVKIAPHDTLRVLMIINQSEDMVLKQNARALKP